MHADRTNRAMLIVFALLLIAGGVTGALTGFGVLGTAPQHRPLLDNQFSSYLGAHGDWLWPLIALAALIIALLALRWMLALLFSTDRVGDFRLPGDRGGGPTSLAASALTAAVVEEIRGYLGVQAAQARLIGDSTSPTLVISAALEQTADLHQLRRRIETQAVAHARQSMDDPDLPVRLDLTVTTANSSRVS